MKPSFIYTYTNIHSLVHIEASGAQREDVNGTGGRLPIPCATLSPDTLFLWRIE